MARKKAKPPVVKARCEVGPYKGYLGAADWDETIGAFGGCVLGTTDVVHFEGDTLAEVAVAFRDSVDEYLRLCQQRGTRPDKPFSGKVLLRLPAELHRQVSMAAQARDVSLNSLLIELIQAGVEK